MRRAITIVPLLLAIVLHAQQDEFRSKLSIQGGMVRSLGDITSGLKTFDPERTAMLGVSYERFLSYGVSLYGGYEHLRFLGNDRETGRKDRSLNFLAHVNTAQIGLRLYADNGRLLNYDARFAPFVQLGIGAGIYEVYGDLYDADGARYNYWSDGTIRSLPEGAPDASTAQLVEQDGKFETRLTNLATEEGKPRDAWFIYVPARLGMKWRISERFSAELAYAFNWTFTDHLDDVSSDYPATFTSEELAYISNPAGHAGPRGNNGQNDHFHHLSLGLSVGIGRRSHKFRMPPVRAMAPTVAPPKIRKDSIVAPPRIETEPADTIRRQVIIEVESIRVGRFEVDTIIVRGSRSTDTLAVREDTVKRVRPIEADSLVKAERVQPDSVEVGEEEMEKVRTEEGEGSEEILRAQPDTVPVIDMPDTLKRGVAPNDTTMVPSSMDVNGTQRTVTSETVITPDQEPEERTGPGTKNTRSTEAEPTRTVEHRTTERIIERTAPPVVVVQKEVVRDTVVKEVPVVVGDTVPVKADTAVVTPKDSVMKAAPRSTAPVRSEPTPPVRSALEMQRDHAMQMNRMLNDRIQVLEKYLAAQEEFGGAADVDSLRQRITQLDGEIAALRGGAVAPVTDSVPSIPMAIMDSVRFTSESFHVRQSYQESLQATARRIIEQDAPKVMVTGHTDRSGDADYNKALSQRRAEAVAEVLRTAGVPSDRIKVKGLGQELASERHDRNERVVVVHVAQPE